jgi:hypothetical protein
MRDSALWRGRDTVARETSSRPGDSAAPAPSREAVRAEAGQADARAELARLPEWYASEPDTPDAVIYGNVGAIEASTGSTRC